MCKFTNTKRKTGSSLQKVIVESRIFKFDNLKEFSVEIDTAYIRPDRFKS